MAKSVAENVKRIRDAYEFGTAIRGSAPGRAKYGEGEVVKLAEEQGCAVAEAYRARHFARLFSKSDLENLCNLRGKNGNSLTWGHITTVLKVPSKQERWSLLKIAAKRNWSVRALAEEVNRRFPNKRGWGGGNYRLADDTKGLLQQIAEKSDSWLRFDEQLKTLEEGYRDDLPTAVRNALQQVHKAMHLLKQKAKSAGSRAPRKKK